MGYVLEKVARYEDAVAQYQAALDINPNLPLLYVSLGNMYFAMGEVDLAVESYLRANSLAPTESSPAQPPGPDLCSCRASTGRPANGRPKPCGRIHANPYLHGNLGRMYYHNGQKDLAIPELALAVRGGLTQDGVSVTGLPLDPADARAVEFYYTYGLALAHQDQCDEAIQVFQAFLQGVPDDETAQANAVEGLVLCGVIEPTPTPRPAATPGQ